MREIWREGEQDRDTDGEWLERRRDEGKRGRGEGVSRIQRYMCTCMC